MENALFLLMGTAFVDENVPAGLFAASVASLSETFGSCFAVAFGAGVLAVVLAGVLVVVKVVGSGLRGLFAGAVPQEWRVEEGGSRKGDVELVVLGAGVRGAVV